MNMKVKYLPLINWGETSQSSYLNMNYTINGFITQ